MRGPLPQDVTLDVPHWWQPGMPLLPPADNMAPVPLKRKRDTSAEPKTDHAKRTYMRIPRRGRSCGSRTSTLIKRVSMASHSLTTFARRSISCRSSSGPWHPTHSADGMTAAHLTSAADHPWTCHHSPCRVSRTSHMPSRPGSVSASPLGSTSTTVCCASSTSEFEPKKEWTRQFLRRLQLSWKLKATCTRHRPSEADIARERKLLQLRVIYLCDRFKIS